MSESCELCEANPLTRWWFEDRLCWVAECESCGVPMVVWREHGSVPPPADVVAMIERLTSVAEEAFVNEEFFVDRRMRQIPDHFHAHARRRWRYPHASGSSSL
jgi:hypothetical protein